MSLVQHLTSIDGVDEEPTTQLEVPPNWNSSLGYGTIDSGHLLRPVASQQKSLRRVISYDVIANPQTPQTPATHTKALTPSKVSTARRLAQVLVTILSCWLASGVVFGFAALKPILVDQGVYAELCTAEELRDGVAVCYEQDLRLNLFFAIGSTTCNVSALPVGTILDRYGARVSTLIGCFCLTLASAFMASAFYIPEFDGYIVGNVFLALGGTFIFVPAYSIANAFPRFSGSIVAAITGAFDASAAVFLIFKLVYEASGGAFSPVKFFLTYLLAPVVIAIAQMTLMNEDAYKTVSQLEKKIEWQQDATRDVHDSDDDYSDKEIHIIRNIRRERRASKLQELDRLLGDLEERQLKAEREEDRQAVSGVWGALHGKTSMQQIRSPFFILIALLTILQMLRMNFFIATVRSQYAEMLGSRELGRKMNSFFDVALPIGGVAATPFIGLLLDNVSTAGMLAVLVTMITAVGVIGCLPFLWAGYCNIILFVLLRPLYYSAMSDYAVKVFGFATFGRVYGCIIALSGLVNLTQPLIDKANHEYLHDNPIPINICLTGLGLVIGTSLVVYVWTQQRRMEERQEAWWSEWERNRVIREELEDESEAVSFLEI